MDAALAASGRAEASLSSLMRAVQTLSAGVSGARESNVEIVRELESLRQMLGQANEHQLALKNRLKALEAALEQAQRDAARERAFLADQHDAFIVSLIEDHERVVTRLREELEEARRPTEKTLPFVLESDASALGQAQLKEQLDAAQRTIEKLVGERERTRETLLRLQSQRDEAQAAVARLSREREHEHSEMSQLRIQQGMSDAMLEAALSERRPPSFSRGPTPQSVVRPTARPLGASNSSAPTLRPQPSQAQAPPPATRPSTPPVLQFKSLVPPPSTPISEGPQSTLLKAKPHPSTRPLVGYSMTEASEDRVDTSRLTSPSRPPKI